MTVHQVLYLRNGEKLRTYCTCGWIAGFWCEAEDRGQNFVLSQDDFIAHLEDFLPATEYVTFEPEFDL